MSADEAPHRPLFQNPTGSTAPLPIQVGSSALPLEARQEFFLPVHGFIWLYQEEVRVVDHPAFQRLRGVFQLGQAHLVYPGATHRRFEHCLGAVHVLHRMISAVERNARKPARESDALAHLEFLPGAALTQEEIRFARLGALLHDIGHVPCGHTIEDELQLIDRHDGDSRLDLVFGITSILGAGEATQETEKNKEASKTTPPALGALVDGLYDPYLPRSLRGKIAPIELVRLLIRKKPADGSGDRFASSEELLGSCEEFRLQVCRDMIGNTICADILDYLYRDWYHVGKPRQVDERLLQYMQIRRPRSAGVVPGKATPTPQDMFVVSLGNRPKIRTDAVSEILGLLEWRYQLAESVLFHRTKLTASSMLERALYELWGQGRSQHLEHDLLRSSDETFLPWCYKQAETAGKDPKSKERAAVAMRLLLDLMERRIFVELDTCFHEEKPGDFTKRIERLYGRGNQAAENRWLAVSNLEEDFGLARGSLAMYCPTRDMNAKIPEVKIYCNGDVQTFNKYEEENENILSGGHLHAQEMRFHRLWRVHFFIREDERERVNGEGLLLKLISACRCLALGDLPPGVDPLEMVRDFALHLSADGRPHAGHSVAEMATIGNRAKASPGWYPTGIPSIKSLLKKK